MKGNFAQATCVCMCVCLIGSKSKILECICLPECSSGIQYPGAPVAVAIEMSEGGAWAHQNTTTKFLKPSYEAPVYSQGHIPRQQRHTYSYAQRHTDTHTHSIYTLQCLATHSTLTIKTKCLTPTWPVFNQTFQCILSTASQKRL